MGSLDNVSVCEDVKGFNGDASIPQNNTADASDWANDVSNRHDQAVTRAENYLMVDGHVKYIKLSGISAFMPANFAGAGPLGVTPANAPSSNMVAVYKHNTY